MQGKDFCLIISITIGKKKVEILKKIQKKKNKLFVMILILKNQTSFSI